MMKLSEAMRLGSMLRPQAFGDVTDGLGTCAFGAAEEAVFGHIKTGLGGRITWPWVDKPQVCPECWEVEQMGATVISKHLNDTHRWTRQEIADWVESVEPADEIAVPVEDMAVAQV